MTPHSTATWYRRLAIVPLLVAACGGSGTATVSPTAVPTVAAEASGPHSSGPAPSEASTTSAPWAPFPSYPTADLPADVAAKLQTVLDGMVADGSPDAVAAVVTADGVWAGAAGIDGPDARRAQPADVFNIASVSKPMLAALLLKLAENGKVDLDLPIAGYLGDLPIDTNGATARQLLHMRAGFGDTPKSASDAASADCAKVWSRTDTLVSIPAPAGKLDTFYTYSNPSYKILGYAAEHVTATSLDKAFDDSMFAPLGLDRIVLQTAKRPAPKPWALPIGSFHGSIPLDAFGTGGTLPCVSLSTFSFSTSAVASDAPSLARWAWALFDGELISRTSLDQMTLPVDKVHGLGLDLQPNFLPDLAYGVHGGNAGYAAFLAILPERQAVAVVLVNYQEADVDAAARALLQSLPR
jgi:D-alanyl-D-alanine carboxypeptidase